jgi:hypothetical protein
VSSSSSSSPPKSASLQPWQLASASRTLGHAPQCVRPIDYLSTYMWFFFLLIWHVHHDG